jgi:hypothetical protein
VDPQERADDVEVNGVLHSWMDSRMVEEHLRDLTSSGLATASGIDDLGLGAGGPADHFGTAAAASASVAPLGAGLGRSAPQGGLPRRPLGQHVGTLLIRAGTRLGGASIRTS